MNRLEGLLDGISEGEAVSPITGRKEGLKDGVAEVNIVFDENGPVVDICKGCTVGERVEKDDVPTATARTITFSVSVALDLRELSWRSFVYSPFCTDEKTFAVTVSESVVGFWE